ncbi:Crp/Fnr family transcriptional regulator [Sphingomonas sp. IC-56]|uniref:Crp/Fnr family transcriptional regulator n=1 Tax=Sphingomonas sp. IC-56 TaxID=2898529 RepID=UPI001E2AB72B|nr:Crp/Fnr family transcriptional regulator [Sphingomonas sp. IC-56]MCD2325462.1 Crp/Fnr family transcriptional regulator [Sphingomonas sp. IC-56]
MIEKHLLKLRARDEISADEEQAIRAAVGETVMLPAEHTFITPGKLLDHSTLVLDGIVARYKDLSDGQRQITELHVAGDFADLHSFTLQYLDHSVMTLTPARIVRMPHKALAEITERYPHLTRVYWFGTNLDAAIHREWELSLGRRSAIQRIAHLFCEMQVRLRIVGLASERHYDLPLTQAVLAECLGLTPVHVNRVLKELREAALVEFRSGRVTILDLLGLRAMADFDPSYLYLERKRPR